MCVQFQSVFLTSAGTFLPGPPVGNEAMDQFIAPLDASSARIKRRILAENGIRTRHYAIDTTGSTVFPAATMAAFAAAMLIGSVHLAWHYAVDGLVSIVLVTALWRGFGRLVQWEESLAVNGLR